MKRLLLSIISLSILLSVTQVSAQDETVRQLTLVGYGEDGAGDIYLMNEDGSELVNLSSSAANDLLPRWSPDGEHIAYASEIDGNRDVYVMDADGQNPVNLTHDPAFDSHPVWGPDGTHILFLSNRGGGRTMDIYSVALDGTAPVQLTNTDFDEQLVVVPPDGEHLVYQSTDMQGGWFLMLALADGSDETVLHSSNFGSDTLQLSPDGSQLLLTQSDGSSGDIMVVHVDGSGITNLTESAEDDYAPAWSPDGTQIVYSSRLMDEANLTNLNVMDADGGNITQLTQFLKPGLCANTVWSPDGERIAFFRTEEDAWDIYSIDVNSGDVVNLTADVDEKFTSPAWRPQ